MKYIAEIGGNHCGSFEKVINMIGEARRAGATHVKFQTFKPEDMAINGEILTKGLWKGRTALDLYREAQLPWEWHEELFSYAREAGITPFSSPFSAEAVDFLESLDCPLYKIASYEANDTILLRKVAKTVKPVIISTGMVNDKEIRKIIEILRQYRVEDITLLRCVSSYPADPKHANLHRMQYFGRWAEYGLSDHTHGIGVSVAAVALGASVIERHFNIDGCGLDAEFSLLPHQFSQMVEECERARIAIQENSATERYYTDYQEYPELKRSLHFSKDIPKNHFIGEADLRTYRSGLGLNPLDIDNIIGCTTIKAVKSNQPVTWDVLNGDSQPEH